MIDREFHCQVCLFNLTLHASSREHGVTRGVPRTVPNATRALRDLMPRSPSRGMLLLASTSMFASATTCAPARHARHALELRDRGYTVIADAGLDPTLVADAKVACAAALSRSLDMIDAIGLDAMEDSYAFAEIDKRHRLRWSLQATRQGSRVRRGSMCLRRTPESRRSWQGEGHEFRRRFTVSQMIVLRSQAEMNGYQ